MKVNFADRPKPKLPLYPETEHKLFVGNLSWTVTSEMLTETFQRCGNVVGARVLYDGDTGRSRGYGFVCYSTSEEMDGALSSLNGMVCKFQHFTVRRNIICQYSIIKLMTQVHFQIMNHLFI
jgi:RNA recognition motif-containing protein